MWRLLGDLGLAHPMKSHLSQERRNAPLSLAGQHFPNRRRQIAHRGIQANAPGRIALRTRFSAIRAIPSIYERQSQWDIEQLFRTMKTHGFDIEAVRMMDEAPRRNPVAATPIAAVTIQQLVHARDGGEKERLRPLVDVFEPEDRPLLEAYCARLQGKTQRQKNPHPPETLAYAAWVLARLGGWTGYYGKPGPIVMLRGWLKFQDGKYALAAFRASENV